MMDSNIPWMGTRTATQRGSPSDSVKSTKCVADDDATTQHNRHALFVCLFGITSYVHSHKTSFYFYNLEKVGSMCSMSTDTVLKSGFTPGLKRFWQLSVSI